MKRKDIVVALYEFFLKMVSNSSEISNLKIEKGFSNRSAQSELFCGPTHLLRRYRNIEDSRLPDQFLAEKEVFFSFFLCTTRD